MSFSLVIRTLVLPLLIFVSPVTAQSVLRVIEQNLGNELAAELAQHEADLRQEGWKVETITVPKRGRSELLQHVTLAEKTLWPRMAADPGVHIFFVGMCPLPYSGQALNPDGHPGTTGAYACTAYYATPSEQWTDVRDNSGMLPSAKQKNVPGDGKFDQDYLPGAPLACIGFLDLSMLNPKSWGSLLDKTSFQRLKYREWFSNQHAYRTGMWSPRHLTANGRNSTLPSELFWNWSLAEYGVEPLFFNSVDGSSVQDFAIGDESPFGLVFDFKALNVSALWWAARTTPWAVLYLYYGSYQVDFGSTQLMNPLGGGGLATATTGFGNWELVGASRLTLGQLWNQTLARNPKALGTVLYGDPTLRLPEL